MYSALLPLSDRSFRASKNLSIARTTRRRFRAQGLSPAAPRNRENRPDVECQVEARSVLCAPERILKKVTSA
jgi:hypothetical protein